MEIAIILGLILSSCLSLAFFTSRNAFSENDIIDLAAAEKIKAEYLVAFMKRKIMAGKLMRAFSHIVTICLLYICFIHFWS